MFTPEDLALGEWLRGEILSNVTTDTEGWAFDLAHRVADRVQIRDFTEARLIPVVTWHEDASAFVVPGRYVYLSRAFLQLAMPEDAVALAFAHELAHARLGHLNRFRIDLPWLERLPGVAVLPTLMTLGHRVLFSAESESEADAWGFDRCRAVGYDGASCLELFRALERNALDHHDSEGVFGTEEPPEDAREGMAPWKAELSSFVERAKAWQSRVRRGYAPLRARRDALQLRMDG